MTAEQAITVLNMVEAHGLADEAKQMAIQALQAQADGDAVSRDAVIDIIEDVCPIYGNDYRYILREKVNALPTVAIPNKAGHWKKYSSNWMCDQCNRLVSERSDYCPHCGCKMD